MNPSAEKLKRSNERKPVLPDVFTLVRLALSIILLVLAYNINTTQFISMLMLVAAIMICGFDIVIYAIYAVLRKDFFNNSCLIMLAAVAGFAVGCYIEATVFVVVYQACRVFFEYAQKLTKQSALFSLPNSSEESFSRQRSMLNRCDSSANVLRVKLEPYYSIAVRVLTGAAIFCSILLPLVTDMTYVMSIRRGTMLIAAIAPCSMFTSLSLCTAYGLCHSAASGVIVDEPETLDKAVKLKSIVFDKSDVITAGAPKIASIISPVLDNESFLRSAAYIAYKSEQRIASAIVGAYNGDIFPEYIQEFNDIPGYGMEVKIEGRQMLLGTLQLLESRGICLDAVNVRKGNVLYLIISGRYAGSIVFNENINPYAAKTVSILKELGVASILVAEDGMDVCEKTAKSINISDFFPCCDTAKKLSVVKDIKQSQNGEEALMYVSAENIGYHSDADLDAKVGERTDTEDLRMSNIGIYGLPTMVSIARRVKKISCENIALSAIVKVILIILALTGNATLWFVALLDFSAGIFGVLNVSRISK